MLIAERLALPYATVLVIAAGSFIRPELVAAPLDEVRAEHGLPADPDLAMLSRYSGSVALPAQLSRSRLSAAAHKPLGAPVAA